MTSRKYNSLKSVIWDYNIPLEDIEKLISGKASNAGHYTLKSLFIKMASGLPWFTIVDIFGAERVKEMLTDDVIGKIWPISIQKKYRYVRKRLQEALPDSE
jgi:hypothetical protein